VRDSNTRDITGDVIAQRQTGWLLSTVRTQCFTPVSPRVTEVLEEAGLCWLETWDETRGQISDLMEEAKATAIGSYRTVLEDWKRGSYSKEKRKMEIRLISPYAKTIRNVMIISGMHQG
jgi:hypothetical protein